jgi:electron transfer flavoprotein beta subunit
MSPLIAVCVAPADLRPEVDRLTGEVRADLRRADLTASDAAAIEHGLTISEAWGAEALVVAAGPPAIDTVLAGVGALGCSVLRIGEPGAASASGPRSGAACPRGTQPRTGADMAGDPQDLARRLAQAIRTRGQPDLVICGDRSADHGVGAVPGCLAHQLGLGQALGLVSLSVSGAGQLRAERRLDGGWRERLDITGPAVVSVEAAGVRLRRARLDAALSAGAASVPFLDIPARPAGTIRFGAPEPCRPLPQPVPAPDGTARQRLLALTGALSQREPARVVGPLEAAAGAEEVLDFLRRSGVAPD